MRTTGDITANETSKRKVNNAQERNIKASGESYVEGQGVPTKVL